MRRNRTYLLLDNDGGARRIHAIGLYDQLADAPRANDARGRIQDAVHRAHHVRVHRAVLESQRGIAQRAVDQPQVVDVAHTLQTLDRAVDQGEVGGIPPEILPDDDAIFHHHVRGVPKTVLAVEVGVLDAHVTSAVKAIIAVQTEALGPHVVAVHTEVVPRGLHVFQNDVAAMPHGLGGVRHTHAAQGDARSPAESLGRVDKAILDRDFVGVPNARPCGFAPRARIDRDIPSVPQGVFPSESTPREPNALALFEGRFPVLEQTVLYLQILAEEQGAFACITLV